MAKYEKYAEYQDSGIEWLGKVPSNWDITRIAYVFSEANAGEVIDKNFWGSGNEILYTCNRNPLKSDFSTFPSEKRTVENDLLLTRNGTPYVHKPIVGSIYSNVVQRITLIKKFDRNYLSYCLGNSAKNLQGYGVSIESLNFEMWKSLTFCYPTKDVQNKIVDFLDYETTQIDTLITKQEKLIELLTEKRQAVISHAVTKGLNPDVNMKDSAGEWLGQVPEYWEKKILKYIVSQQGGGTPDKSNLAFWDGDIPWVSPKDMKVDYISTSQDKITAKAIEQSSTKLVPIGSVLMVVRGMILIHSVPVALTQEAVTINQDMKALTPNKMLDSEYFLYLLKGLKDYLLDYVETSGHGTKCLRSDDFMNMPLFLPNVEEQKNIVEYIKNKSKVFDALTEKAESAIQLMQERRTALISSAVTGKIDVRNWQHPNKNNDAKTELGA